MISVVITCYKEGKLLYDAYQSLLEQTDKDFEIIIINDRSPDDETNRVCEELATKDGVRVIVHAVNGGLAQARKTGYKEMKGTICVPLDADDVLPPNAIADIRKAFVQYPDAGFIFGNYWKVEVASGNKELVDTAVIADENNKISVSALAANWILLGTSPCKKHVFEDIGGASQQFSYDIDDMDFWIKVMKKGYIGYHIDTPIYLWNRQVTGMNFNLKGERMLELFKTHSDFFMLHHAAEGFQPVVYGPFLKAGDWRGCKEAVKAMQQMGIKTGKYQLISFVPNFILKGVYRLYKILS